MLISITAFSQSGEVYSWNGSSGSWHNANNWTVNGATAITPPSKIDIAYINTSQSIEIALEENAFAEAITTTGEGEVSFKAMKKFRLEIGKSCILSENTSVNKNVTIELKGEGDGNYFHVPPALENQINLKSADAYQNIRKHNSTRSICPYFTIIPNPTRPKCNGFSDGIASIEVPVDGVGPYSYQWIGGPTTRQWANVGAGTYTVIVFDLGQGTPCNIDVFVNEPGPLTVFSMNATPPLCPDGCDGTATPIVIGGNGGYTLNWSSGETGLNPTQLCTTFTLNVVDQSGCVYDTTYIFTNAPEPVDFQADITNVDCFGNDNGAIDLTIQGGTGGFTYSWIGPNGFTASTKDISGLKPGDYTIEVEDANNCLADAVYSISENVLLEATITKDDNICGGELEGGIQVTPVGGLSPYTFSWSGPDGFTSTDQNISGLESGLYEFTITDAALCTYTQQVTIAEPVEIQVNFTSVNVLCAGSSTGSASATASGGTPGYTYQWSGPNSFSATGPGISNVPAGIYEVTVTDVNLCTQEETLEITEPDAIQADFTIGDITCHGGNDGSIQTSIIGGNPGYTISWTGPGGFTSSDLNISSLLAGAYTATITDDNACEIMETVEILNPDPMVLTADITPSSCAMGSDGGINLSVSGGNEPYFYTWTGPGGFASNAENLNNRSAGAYTVTVRDANLCEVTATYTITSPDPMTAVFVKENASCFGSTDGSIQVTASGGQEPYTYIWLGPAGFISMDQNISGLLGGSYSVQIMDAGGCMDFFNVTISQPPKMNITGPVTPVTCFGGSNGAIQSIVNGGTPGYTYSWTGPNGFAVTTKDISGVPAGVYTLTVTDAIGCSKARDYTVAEPLEISVDATITDVVCAGASDGDIELQVSNGVAPYTYAWTGPGGFTSTDKDIVNLSGGNYNLTITDGNSCVFTHSYTVIETVVIIIDSDVTHISCFGEANGEITTSVQGGSEPYVYDWTGPNGFTSAQESIDNLEPGFYVLTLTDDIGCEVILTVNITEPEEFGLNIAFQDITCFGNGDGSLSAIISGGTPPYVISWTGPDGFSSTSTNLSNLQAGAYDIEITDSHGCVISGSANINQPLELELIVDITQPGCLVNDGSLTANVTGGTVATTYTYSWKNENGTEIGTGTTILNLSPGDFTITVTDDNGCEVQELIELKRVTFDIAAQVHGVDCFGGSDGNISITPISGTPPYTYAWTGPNGYTATGSYIEDLIAGQYELDVEDAAGCLYNMVYDVEQPEGMNFTATVIPESCAGENNGSISLAISGGTPGYLVSWNGPDGFSANGLNITELAPGTYTASVTDIYGCAGDTAFDIGLGADFNVVLTPTSPVCAGEMSGSIDVEIVATPGSPGPYNFSWTGPNGFADSDQNISGLAAGNYEVIVTNAAGCTRIESIELIMPDSILIDLDIMQSNCLQTDGSASANVVGGVGTLSVRWLDNSGNEVATGNDLTGVSSGFYTIEVTDDAGCVISQTVVISDISGSITGTITQPVCAGGDDGSIYITVIDGTEPFTYEWTQGGTFISNDENIENLIAGIYNVTVTDDNGCIYSASFNVINPEQIGVDADITHVSCHPSSGAISLEITNAALPFEIDWIGPDGFTGTGENIQDLIIGTYIYSITTADNCFITGSVEVEDIPELVVSAVVKNVLCGGESTGYIDISVTGGTSPISYLWSDTLGFTSSVQDIADVPAGTYTVVITDANDCFINEVYEITENEPIAAIYTIVQPDCDTDNGSISVVLSGGVVATDYFISWTDLNGNPFTPTVDLTDLGVGVYVFSASDDNGCSIDTTIVLSNPDADITALISNESCPAVNDGSITLSISEVEEPFTIEWTGPGGFTSTDQDITGLEPGTYEYNITGANNCEYIGTAVVDAAEPIALIATISNACFETASGKIDLEVSGGDEPYEFLWTGPDGFTSETQNVNGLFAGEYQVVITYSAACTETFDFTVIENPEIILDFTQNDILCFGEVTGSIDLSVSGGAAPYFIGWTGPEGFTSQDLSLTNLPAGDYTLTVIDDNGCDIDTVVVLFEPQSLEVVETIVGAGCSSPESLGMIELMVSGGTPNYFIAWNGPNGFTSIDFAMIGLEPGIYNYTITDQNGCTYEDEIEIFDVDPIEVDLVVQQISCFGESDGGASVTISGGLEPYQMLWEDSREVISEESSVEDLPEGIYTINITDSAGCSFSQSFEIVEPDPIAIEIIETNDASCNTSFDGSISIELSGGSVPYSYSWTGAGGYESNEQNLDSLAAGQYDLHVTDLNGCEAMASVEISYMVEISVDGGEDFAICQSDLPVQVIGSGLNVEVFKWTDLDGNVLSETDVLNFASSIGTHSLIFIGSNDLCSIQDTIEITVLANPIADAGSDQEVFAEEVFTLGGNPTSVSGASYFWSPNPTQTLNTSLSNPSGYILESTEFVVEVTDVNGCVGTDTVLVEVLPDVIITSGFTPNGDGINDKWIIDNINLFPNNVVHVFNRWGQSVFEQKSYNSGNAWDGTYEGKKLPVGTYYYTIDLKDERFPEPLSGPITIYR